MRDDGIFPDCKRPFDYRRQKIESFWEAFTQDGYYTVLCNYDEPDDLSEEEVDDCIEELQKLRIKRWLALSHFRILVY